MKSAPLDFGIAGDGDGASADVASARSIASEILVDRFIKFVSRFIGAPAQLGSRFQPGEQVLSASGASSDCDGVLPVSIVFLSASG